MTGGYPLRFHINFERTLKKERDVAEHESEYKAADFMLTQKVVNFVTLQCQLGFFDQLLRLLIMRYQLLLLSIDLALDVV